MTLCDPFVVRSEPRTHSYVRMSWVGGRIQTRVTITSYEISNNRSARTSRRSGRTPVVAPTLAPPRVLGGARAGVFRALRRRVGRRLVGSGVFEAAVQTKVVVAPGAEVRPTSVLPRKTKQTRYGQLRYHNFMMSYKGPERPTALCISCKVFITTLCTCRGQMVERTLYRMCQR